MDRDTACLDFDIVNQPQEVNQRPAEIFEYTI